MKFPRNTKVELCADPKHSNVALQHAHLDLSDRERPMLVACNGSALLAVPVEVDADDVGGFVPVEVLTAARKAAGKRADPEVLCRADRFVIPCGPEFPRVQVDAPFPAWRQVVPTTRDAGKPAVRLGVNARLLGSLVKAAGGDDLGGFVALEFYANVRGTSDPGRDDTTYPVRVDIAGAPAVRFCASHVRALPYTAKPEVAA